MPGKALQLKELFPNAVNWIDVGRRQIRRRIEVYVNRIHGESRKRFAFPVDTTTAMSITVGLGYRASRSCFDYFIRHGQMQPPPKDGKHLAWSIENVVGFALQLERLRCWRSGCHDTKKTVWELQAELELQDAAYDTARDSEVQAPDADEMLGAAIDANSIELCQPDSTLTDQLGLMDVVAEDMLGRIIIEPTSRRKARATARRKPAAKPAG